MSPKDSSWMINHRSDSQQPQQNSTPRQLPLLPDEPATLKLFDAPADDGNPDEWDEPDQPAAPSGPELHAGLKLREFLELYVLPDCKPYAAPRNVKQYRESLLYWSLFSGDPTIEQLGRDPRKALRDFVEQLTKLPGRKGELIADNTIRKHIVHVQSCLDRLAPKSRQNKQGCGLIAEAPTIPKPGLVVNEVYKNYSLAEIGRMLDACALASRPTLRGLPPAVWWQSIILVGYNSGLRTETLLDLKFDWLHQDELGWWLQIPPRSIKKKRHGRPYYLTAAAKAAIDQMRSHGGQLVFPMPHAMSWLSRNRTRLLLRAGLPPQRRFGFGGLRKALGTELGKINSTAAKMALGHAGDVTIDFYTHRSVMTEAMDRLPQPPRDPNFGGQRRLFE